MKTQLTLVAVAAAGLLPLVASGQDATNQVRIKHCVVSLVNEAQVPAEFPARTEGGVIREFPVKPGTVVKQGDVIAQIDDSEAKLLQALAEFELESARKEANSDVNVQAAKKTQEVAKAEFDESLQIEARSEGAVTEAEKRRLKLTWERAGLQIEVAQMEMDVAGLTAQSREKQLELATDGVNKLAIKSPIDGVVVQRYRHQGEWIRSGEPVMHIVDMENLRVEGFVDASQLAPQDILGKRVTIEVALTRGQIVKYEATLNYVSPLVEASGDYRVWADIKNKVFTVGENQRFWELRPGLPADMLIHLN